MAKAFDHEQLDKLAEKTKVDQDSFSELYEVLFGPVFSFIFKRLGGNRFQTEEIVSVTFEKALLKIDTYRKNKGHVASWIFRIANNQLIDYYRRRKEVANIDNLAPSKIAENPKAEQALEKRELRDQLLSAMSRLKGSDQLIITLRFFQDYSNSEIAEVINKDPNYVAVRVFRSLRNMRQMLREKERLLNNRGKEQLNEYLNADRKN